MLSRTKPTLTLTRTFLLAVVVVASGCGGPELARTPNLFLRSPTVDPFADVAPPDRHNRVEMLYATDRERTDAGDGGVEYGYGRSPSVAFGACTVSIGDDIAWDTLVEESRLKKRRTRLPISVSEINELVRGPGTPPLVESGGKLIDDPVIVAAQEEARAAVAAIFDERVARAERKEVFLFIHGYNNEFEEAALRMAQLWHFLGRVGVPMIYTWPAGHPGLLRGYNYDRESGEYTVYHLKGVLKFIASSSEVEKIHIISHSRGTDVAISALRELNIEYKAAGRDTREALKLGNLVLAAPDLDFEVVRMRIGAERLHLVPERLTIYLSEDDKAIGLSSWLFASLKRLGQLTLDDIPPELRESLAAQHGLQFIHVEAKVDFLGHGYFISNPAVLSDLILVLRDDRPPGAEHGRPLEGEGGGFWVLRDSYPQFADDASP